MLVTEELLTELGFVHQSRGVWYLENGTIDLFVADTEIGTLTVEHLVRSIMGAYETRMQEDQWGEDW